MKNQLLLGLSILTFATLAVAHGGHTDAKAEHQEAHAQADTNKTAQDSTSTPQMTTVKGEVLDMACYLSDSAQGPDHATCAETCIESGLPVGLKDEKGKVYLLIGKHKPINAILAPYGGKIITVRGKVVSRDGINLIEDVEVVQ